MTAHSRPARIQGQRIISLDFDGVLHPSPRLAVKPELPVFCWIDCLDRLLVSHPDVRLLVHSSWREAYRPDEIADMLMPLESRFLGVAPPGSRGEAIVQWQLRHSPHARILVIDDDESEFSSHPDLQVLYCDPAKGLSAVDVQEAIAAWLEQTSVGRQ